MSNKNAGDENVSTAHKSEKLGVLWKTQTALCLDFKLKCD